MSVCGSCSAAQAVSNALSCLRRSWKARKFVLEATVTGGRLSWYGDCNNQNDADYTRCDGRILRCMIGTATHTKTRRHSLANRLALAEQVPETPQLGRDSLRRLFAPCGVRYGEHSVSLLCWERFTGHGFGAVARLHATFKMSTHRGGIRTPRPSTSQAVAQTTIFTVSTC